MDTIIKILLIVNGFCIKGIVYLRRRKINKYWANQYLEEEIKKVKV